MGGTTSPEQDPSAGGLSGAKTPNRKKETEVLTTKPLYVAGLSAADRDEIQVGLFRYREGIKTPHGDDLLVQIKTVPEVDEDWGHSIEMTVEDAFRVALELIRAGSHAMNEDPRAWRIERAELAAVQGAIDAYQAAVAEAGAR
jgi:hypothetical protein